MSNLKLFIEQLRQQLTLSEVIQPHVKLRARGQTWLGLCPFHKEKTPSFNVNNTRGFYHCFGCGAHGDFLDFIMQHQRLPFLEAVAYLAHQAGVTMPTFTPPTQDKKSMDQTKRLLNIHEEACIWYQQQLQSQGGFIARHYLEKRDVSLKTTQRFSVGFSPADGLYAHLQALGFSAEDMLTSGLIMRNERGFYDRFRRRLMFPIHDIKGRVIAFGGRVLTPAEPKYLNSPETPLFSKGQHLYHLHHAQKAARQKNRLILVEGYMDVMMLAQHGIEETVAPLGTAVTPEQIQAMWKIHPTPTLCFDGDTAGSNAARRSAERCLPILKPGYSLQFSFLNAGTDPDTFLRHHGSEAFEQHLKKSSPLVDMVWDTFLQETSLQTPEQQALAQKKLSECTQQITDSQTRYYYAQELRQRLRHILFRRRQTPAVPAIVKPLSNSRRILNQSDKIVQGQKILLATLINHPTLIAEMEDDLMIFEGNTPQIRELFSRMMAVAAQSPEALDNTLENKLRQSMGDVDVLFEDSIYLAASFARPTASIEDARKGWRTLWAALAQEQNLNVEAQHAVQAARTTLDAATWKRLKQLKTENTTLIESLKEFEDNGG